LRIAAAAGALWLAFAGAAQADEDDDCPLFFPDFSCDRQVRPEGAVMPMSAPYIFEDPYIQTGANFVGIWHEFPHDSIFEGGQVGVLALQARLAITDRVAFIATKDGLSFWDVNSKLGTGTKVLGDETGFFNISAGFKAQVWNWEDEEGNQSAVLTPSLRYEIPVGQQDVYQGNDSGIIIPAVSGAYRNGPWHIIADLGGEAPINNNKNSSLLFYNVHVSHAFDLPFEKAPFLVPFIELNGLHYTKSGDGERKVHTRLGTLKLKTADAALGGVNGQEGVDVANIGNKNVKDNDIITMAWGLRMPLDYGLSVGASYERPISNKKDIFEQRVTFMLTWEL
jgi:hypothetical protein